jgi:hypothetical protein
MLKEIDIRFSGSEYYSPAEMNAIETAFRTSASLESVRIVVADSAVAQSILRGLKDGIGNARYKLHELRMYCSYFDDVDYWIALSEFTLATTYLRHLQIEMDEFMDDNMIDLLDCFDEPSTISKLSLRCCSVDSDAMRQLTTSILPSASPNCLRTCCS